MLEKSENQQLRERSLGEILNETFAVYGRRFIGLISIVAIVQVPVALLALIPTDGLIRDSVVAIVNFGAGLFVYAALVAAVCQHYVFDAVSVGGCYARVMWRVVSVVILGLLFAVLMTLALLPQLIPIALQTIPLGISVLWLILGVGLLILTVYLMAVPPAIILEGYHFVGAVRRSVRLVRSEVWRILGHLLVYTLIALGLVIVLSTPFALAVSLGTAGTFVSNLTQIAGSLVVGVLVPPVVVIATTLLYFDLRVRNERFDLRRLSLEMGVATT